MFALEYYGIHPTFTNLLTLTSNIDKKMLHEAQNLIKIIMVLVERSLEYS